MAVTKIKSTYSLDTQTVHLLEAMARRWNCSKSEALRRSIRLAASEQQLAGEDVRVAILERLQAGANLSEADARSWEDQNRKERRASGKRKAVKRKAVK